MEKLKWTKTVVKTENGLQFTYTSNRPLTPDERKSFEPIELTPEEREAEDERQRRMEAKTNWIASAETLEEQQRRGAQVWDEEVERPRMARRIAAAFRAKLRPMSVRAPRRTNGSSGRPRAAATRSSAKSGDSGEDGLDEPPGWRWAHSGVAA